MEFKFDKINWRKEKILVLIEARIKAQELREQGKKLATLNGAFDLMHIGHLDQLEEAKKQGDVLFVGINSDKSVKEGKGAGRPINPEQARAALLAALECVDYVIVIDAPYKEVQDVLIKAIRPAVHVNGPDYGKPDNWIEWPVMQEVGAKGYVVNRRNDVSTSGIVKKIQELNGGN